MSNYNILALSVLVYYVIMSLILFFVMGYDKKISVKKPPSKNADTKKKVVKKKQRVAEHTLFILGLMGGFLGGLLGMIVFRHKTNKIYFYSIYYLSLFFNTCFLFVVFYFGGKFLLV